VVLRPGQVLCTQAAGIEALIDIAIEGQHGLLGVAGIERQRPVRVACDVEAGELVRQRHQLGDLCGRALAQHVYELCGIVEEVGLGADSGGRRRLVVERLGWRDDEDHVQSER